MGVVFFFLPFLVFIIPFVFSYWFGLRSKLTGEKRVLVWALLNLGVVFVTSLIFQLLTRNYCSFDGGAPCGLNLKFSLNVMLIFTLLNIPVMYLGVAARFKKSKKASKR